MITNLINEDEVISMLSKRESQQFQFYKYEFKQSLWLRLLDLMQKMEVVRLSFINCLNLSVKEVYSIFDRLSENQNLKKLHLNLSSMKELTEQNYEQMYQKLEDNQQLQTVFCPNYAVMMKAISNMFERNRNIKRVVISHLDQKAFKTTLKFLQSIKRHFTTLKITNLQLQDVDLKQFSAISNIINAQLHFDILKLRKFRLFDRVDLDTINSLFFRCQISQLYIQKIMLNDIQSAIHLISHLFSNPYLQTIRIKDLILTFDIGEFNFLDIDTNNQIQSYELGLKDTISTSHLETFIHNQSELIEFYHLKSEASAELIDVLVRMPQLQKLGVNIKKVNNFCQLINRLEVTLKYVNFRFEAEFVISLFQLKQFQFTLKSKECEILLVLQAELIKPKVCQHISLFLDSLIEQNDNTLFFINLQIKQNILLQILIGKQLIKYSNFISLKIEDTKLYQILQACKIVPILQRIAYMKQIYHNLDFSPNQTYSDFIY